MNMTDSKVEEYLEQVKSCLISFQDKQQILKELNEHIWDVAHSISEEEHVSVNQAFEITLSRMEDPQTLADRFMEEYEGFEQRYTPEEKISEQQFAIIGIVSLIFVGIFSTIFTIISQETWIFWSFTIIPGMGLAIGFLIYLYLKNEKEFDEQVEIFKLEIREQLIKGGKVEFKPTGSLRAFGEHFSGLIGAIVVIGSMILVYWIDTTNAYPVFNENWYTSGFFACYIAWGATLFRYIAQMFLGKIRVSRIILAANDVVNSLAFTTLFMAYPFTLGPSLAESIGTILTDSSILSFLMGIDFYIHLIFGIAASIMAISALYNLFKFGVWQPEEKKSLL